MEGILKSFRKELWIVFPEKQGIRNITESVKECLTLSGIQDGLCLVSSTNVTSSIFTNSDESEMHINFLNWLEKMAPRDSNELKKKGERELAYLDTHLKRTLVGRDIVIAVTKGELELGTWEQILYVEFDGKRRKHVLVKIIGE